MKVKYSRIKLLIDECVRIKIQFTYNSKIFQDVHTYIRIEKFKDQNRIRTQKGQQKCTMCLHMRLGPPTVVTERFSPEIARQIGLYDVYGQIVWNAIV